jgi:phospholipid transport system transporter-binding protein
VTVQGNVVRRGDAFEVSGRMTFQTVPEFLIHTQSLFGVDDNTVTLDLRGVTLADSAGLALMMEWLRLARAARRELRFVNLPEQMRHLVRVSGLTQVFGIKNEQD